MSRDKEPKSMVAVLVIGLFAGIAGSGLYSWFIADEEPDAVKITQAVEPAQPAPGQPRQHAAASLMGQRNAARLSAIEEKLDSMEPAADAPAEAPPEMMTPEQIEQHRQELFTKWEEKLDDLAQEPVDPAWSQRSSSLFSTDVKELEEKGNFTLQGVECHSVSCAAHIEFPSYQEAKSNFSSLLHARYQKNCAREILLPPPDDPSAAYSATVLYNNCVEDEG